MVSKKYLTNFKPKKKDKNHKTENTIAYLSSATYKEYDLYNL
jgi:hypothetical protein